MHIIISNPWRICDPNLHFPKLCSIIEIRSVF